MCCKVCCKIKSITQIVRGPQAENKNARNKIKSSDLEPPAGQKERSSANLRKQIRGPVGPIN